MKTVTNRSKKNRTLAREYDNETVKLHDAAKYVLELPERPIDRAGVLKT